MVDPVINDESYMKMAIDMALQTHGQTGINPVVGSIAVKDGRIIGLGAHLKRGTEHAEIHALNMAGTDAEDCTLYVTLEPCSHYGKTSPCADRIIHEKVRRVVIGTKDPNPKVAGRGIQKLEQHGIEVRVISGSLEAEAYALNEKYNKFIVAGLPFITLKSASTLDGKLASSTGDSRWITNEASRSFVHTLRHQHAAIMVGVNTVIKDNPSLTTRLTVPGIHPVRVIVDSHLRTPLDAKVVTDQQAPTIILTTALANKVKRQHLLQAGVVLLDCGEGSRVDLHLAMKQLADRDIVSILLEGGGRLNGAMLEARLIDKIVLFFAAKIIGGNGPSNFQWEGIPLMKDAVQLSNVKMDPFEGDYCITGYPQYPV